MRKLSKEDLNSHLVKGLIAQFVFSLAYTFAYSIVLGSAHPLAFLEEQGYVHTYLILAMIVSCIPFILCGYLIMLARNRKEHLEQKNLTLALSMITISFVIYLIVTILQIIFEYRNMYDFFIILNYPLMRATLYLELSRLQVNMMMLLATFMPALFVYIGGQLRIKDIKKGS